jgi:transcriptional regulator with XRE-family HTH domain
MKKTYKNIYGKKLKDARLSLKWTQEQMGDALGVSGQTVWTIESGRSFRVLKKTKESLEKFFDAKHSQITAAKSHLIDDGHVFGIADKEYSLKDMTGVDDSEPGKTDKERNIHDTIVRWVFQNTAFVEDSLKWRKEFLTMLDDVLLK